MGLTPLLSYDGCLTINNEVMKSKKASNVIKKKARNNRMETETEKVFIDSCGKAVKMRLEKAGCG